MMSASKIESVIQRLKGDLRRFQTADGVWEGRLSSSALSTAVAAFALYRLDPVEHGGRIGQAMQWLARNANADGGWGDTPQSRSNLSTTLLCRAVLTAIGAAEYRETIAAADAWICETTGDLAPGSIAAAVLACYGRDRTFSTPILAMCAMSGCLGPDETAWRYVPQMPFELAVLPARFYRWIRLPMVSYALPALIAIGLVRHRRRRTDVPGIGWLRDRLTPRLLKKLEALQPENGGFLEAAPLTAFVAMSLCDAGEPLHPVACKAGVFLVSTVRDDGSWPIDTNLKTWCTTQALCALSEASDMALPDALGRERTETIGRWLLAQQGRQRHPYTGAAAGGWAWTDLPGGVPDADDTAGALIALRQLSGPADALPADLCAAARSGVRWLLDIQNSDGGMPTFCRGWGRLPFDRSCPDITAHAIRALLDWSDICTGQEQNRIARALARAVRYLACSRNADGSWTPLWFGNENAPNAENRVYGTAKVMLALCRLRDEGYNHPVVPMLKNAAAWLQDNRHPDGGWGGVKGMASNIEETALAVHALVASGMAPVPEQSLSWMEQKLAESEEIQPTPIGLYFARLWYSEALYPVIYALTAFGAARTRTRNPSLSSK